MKKMSDELHANAQRRMLLYVGCALGALGAGVWQWVYAEASFESSSRYIFLFLYGATFFVFIYLAWETPRRLMRTSHLLLHVSPIELQVVVELDKDSDGIDYNIFIRGEGVSESSYQNWKARILYPFPKGIAQWVEKDLTAEIWFESGKPELMRVNGMIVEICFPRSVNNR